MSMLWSVWILLNMHSFRKNFITKNFTVQFFSVDRIFWKWFSFNLKYFSSCDSLVELPTRALRVNYNLLQAKWELYIPQMRYYRNCRISPTGWGTFCKIALLVAIATFFLIIKNGWYCRGKYIHSCLTSLFRKTRTYLPLHEFWR